MTDRINWEIWAQTLQQRNLSSFAITLLEGSGPLKMIFSQIMMSLSPLINQTRGSQWLSFAQMLEDPEESRSFLVFLLEENKF